MSYGYTKTTLELRGIAIEITHGGEGSSSIRSQDGKSRGRHTHSCSFVFRKDGQAIDGPTLRYTTESNYSDWTHVDSPLVMEMPR